MLFRKYNNANRNKIVICPQDFEDFSSADYDDQHVITILNDKYSNEYFETPPYHYVVSKRDIIQVKSLELQHNDNSCLRAFNDDIKILLLNDNNLFTQFDKIVDLVARLSIAYSLNISSSVFLAKTHINIRLSEQINALIKRSIELRNKRYPIMAVSEAIVDDELIINENIIPINNRLGHTSLLQFANQYSIPVSTLQMLNPHLMNRLLTISDTVFLPKTIAINGIMYAGICKKKAQYFYDISKQLIEDGGELNG